jgi:histone H3/H4
MSIVGVKSPEKIAEKTASSVASKATECLNAAVESKIAETIKAAKVVFANTDGMDTTQ